MKKPPLYRHLRTTRQTGFTLIEVAIVVLIIGIIGALIASRFSGSGAATARAQQLVGFSDSVAAYMKSGISQLGLAYDTAGSAAGGNAIAANNNWLDVAVFGVLDPAGGNLVKSNFASRYELTGNGTLEGSVVASSDPVGSTSEGEYRLDDYIVQLGNDPAGAGHPAVTSPWNCAVIGAAATGKTRTAYFCYDNVPEEVVLALVVDKVDNAATTTTVTTGNSAGAVDATYLWDDTDGDGLYEVVVARSIR